MTESATARSQLSQLKGQRESLLTVLETLAGAAVTPKDEASGVEGWQAADEAGTPWESTYSVQSARKAIEAAERVLTYDKWAWLPSVAGIAKGNYSSNAGFSGQNLSYDLILAVNVPLYDRGQRYAQASEDEAKLVQAQANLIASRARAKSAWLSAKASITAVKSSLEQAESAANLAGRAHKQVESAAREGVMTNLELSDADSRKFFAESAVTQARASYEIRLAELAAAEGKLFAQVQE